MDRSSLRLILPFHHPSNSRVGATAFSGELKGSNKLMFAPFLIKLFLSFLGRLPPPREPPMDSSREPLLKPQSHTLWRKDVPPLTPEKGVLSIRINQSDFVLFRTRSFSACCFADVGLETGTGPFMTGVQGQLQCLIAGDGKPIPAGGAKPGFRCSCLSWEV